MPNSIEKFKNVKTSIDAYKSDSSSLAKIRKENGEKNALALIKMWLISLNDFVNTSRKLTPGQINEIALYIITDYYFLKVSDVYLVITDIKKGKYGQLYESLDGVKILSFFENYVNERINLIFNENLRDHDNLTYKEKIPRKA